MGLMVKEQKKNKRRKIAVLLMCAIVVNASNGMRIVWICSCSMISHNSNTKFNDDYVLNGTVWDLWKIRFHLDFYRIRWNACYWSAETMNIWSKMNASITWVLIDPVRSNPFPPEEAYLSECRNTLPSQQAQFFFLEIIEYRGWEWLSTPNDYHYD